MSAVPPPEGSGESSTTLDALLRHRQALELQVASLAQANAHAAELMAELEEKNERLAAQAQALAEANAHAAELMAELEEAREAEERLRRRGEELRLQTAVDAVLGTSRSMEELLRALLELLVERGIGIAAPVAAAVWDNDDDEAPSLVVALPDGATADAAAAMAAFVHSVTSLEPPAAAPGRTLPALVPLRAKGTVVGALHLGSLGADSWGRWMGLLWSFGAQIGLALERLRAREEILRINRELAAARDEAEEASRAKSAFLANMSHELRTPLNAIIGYGEMLHEELAERGEGQMAADLQKIQSAGRHLLAVINDLLDLSKVEAGKMELFLEPVAVARVIEDAVTLIEPLRKEADVTFAVSCAPDAGNVRADAVKFRQVLFNLLSNACKFSRGGTVTVAARRLGPEVSIAVTDTGIGMTPAELARIFQPFTQADASTTRRFGGTGLGLTISQRFCQMMGGHITVESEPGRGSCFTVTMPSDATVTAASPLRAEGDGTVLVVDDDPSARELVARLLAKQGIAAIGAASGEEALRLVRAARPRLITLDVMMPQMDGWSVLRALKADPDLATIPVVMVTVVDDRNQAFVLGADDYIVKPVDPSRLQAVLRRFRCEDRACRILVVDDDRSFRELVATMVRSGGGTAFLAENGRRALALLPEAAPTLVVLDLMMPELDGFGFLEEMRKDPRFQTVPVLVVTAMELSAEHLERLHRRFVEAVLTKDAGGIEGLITRIARMVRSPAAAPRGQEVR